MQKMQKCKKHKKYKNKKLYQIKKCKKAKHAKKAKGAKNKNCTCAPAISTSHLLILKVNNIQKKYLITVGSLCHRYVEVFIGMLYFNS